MNLLAPLSLPSHGSRRATFEGDSDLRKTVALATALISVFALGISLIVHGLL